MPPASPVEVVVIRDRALRRPVPRSDDPPVDSPPGFTVSDAPSADSESHEREAVSLTQMMSCDVRQAVLLSLARGGASYVGQLVERLNSARPWAMKVDQKLLSHHLTHLRRARLVHERRRGRQHWYDLDEAHVVYQQHPGGGFSLKVRARGWPVAVTIQVGRLPEKD
jgi:DNA-binding transcriptional ArsR family regulator